MPKAVCLFFVLFLSLGFALLAASDSREQLVHEIAEQLRCPVCRGIPIDESPAELAQAMMRQIRQKVAQGQNREEVLAYFVDRYGEWILLKPKPQGWNLTLWILPLLALCVGITVLVLAVSKWTKNKEK